MSNDTNAAPICQACGCIIGVIAGAEHLSDPEFCGACLELWLADNADFRISEQPPATAEILGAIGPCRLCGHEHAGRCAEPAPNAQFTCACPGECAHGKHPACCRECTLHEAQL